INNILYNILNIYTTIYLNNILIFLNNKADYERYISNILKRLTKTNLQINTDKYEFYTKKIKYLGFIIILGGIKMDLEKI
ncbi:hypothetical protein NEUTE1DRAFT_42028, partial [Neurospora tetrasperma FGSC 2508]